MQVTERVPHAHADRRGSRGGRNRKKKPAAVTADGTPAPVGVTTPGDDAEFVPDDDTDATADRGLTTDDVADEAREDAGLPPVTPMAPGARPKIGDTRPAPVVASSPGNGPPGNGAGGAPTTADGAATGEKKRRRRRGGRGRGGSGAGGGTGTQNGGGTRPSAGSPTDDVVRADLGMGDAVLELDDDVLERRRGRTRKGRPAGRYLMAVHVLEGGHTHIAILEGRNLVEHSLATPTGSESIDGNIYLGRVQNVLPGMEAAFVDIGTPKNGVLYRGDVAFDPNDVEGGGKPKIERMLKNGQSVLVQVTKNPIAHKGARLTQEVSLAGRFVVMVPGEPDTYGISKRLPDDERKRLRRVLDGLRPNDAGLIVRTAAEGATARSWSATWRGCGRSGSRSQRSPRSRSRPSCSTRSPTSCSASSARSSPRSTGAS